MNFDSGVQRTGPRLYIVPVLQTSDKVERQIFWLGNSQYSTFLQKIVAYTNYKLSACLNFCSNYVTTQVGDFLIFVYQGPRDHYHEMHI